MRIVIVILVALAGYAFLRRRSIRSGAQARKLVESGAILLDVRTPAEFAAGHIKGALNIPVQELAQRMSELPPRQRQLVVYCRSGARSHRAKGLLRTAGYESVYDLGAMSSW